MIATISNVSHGFVLQLHIIVCFWENIIRRNIVIEILGYFLLRERNVTFCKTKEQSSA